MEQADFALLLWYLMERYARQDAEIAIPQGTTTTTNAAIQGTRGHPT